MPFLLVLALLGLWLVALRIRHRARSSRLGTAHWSGLELATPIRLATRRAAATRPRDGVRGSPGLGRRWRHPAGTSHHASLRPRPSTPQRLWPRRQHLRTRPARPAPAAPGVNRAPWRPARVLARTAAESALAFGVLTAWILAVVWAGPASPGGTAMLVAGVLAVYLIDGAVARPLRATPPVDDDAAHTRPSSAVRGDPLNSSR